jgi:hypothetical protein
MNRALISAPSRPGRFALAAVFGLALSLGCSSSGGVDSGPPPTAAEYFNLTPNLCFSYTTGDAGRPTRGLLIQSVSSPVGVSITTLHHGATEQVEYLTGLDGGTAFLNQRNVFPSATSDAGIDNRLFSTPLTYLSVPLQDGQANLSSSSDYTGTSTGTETFIVSLLGQSFIWNGIAADAGSAAFPLQFSGQDDGGGGLTQNKTMLPWVGFVQLTATDDTGASVTFTLTAIDGYDAGTVCGN